MKRRRCRICGTAGLHNAATCPERRPKPNPWVPLTPPEKADIREVEASLARIKRSTATLDAATRTRT